MSDNTTSIHLRVGDIKFSIEGSPEYVNKHYKQMARDLNLQEKLQDSAEPTEKAKSQKAASQKGTKDSTIEEFGEWLKNLLKGLTNKDKALVASYFNQLRSKNQVFRVRDLSHTLKNQGIKIANPSGLINNVVKSQNIVQQVSREGRQKYFQLTKEGEKYICDLLSFKEK